MITRLDWGGAPDIVRIICTRLDADSFDVRLVTGVTLNPSAKTASFLRELGGRVTVIPRLERNIHPLRDLLALIQLLGLFRREKFDIVHTHTAKAGALARIAAFLAGVKVIIHTPHGHNLYGYFGPLGSKMVVLLERFLSVFTDKIIALTELEKNDLLGYKVARREKVEVIYQGIHLEEYFNVSQDKEAFKAAFGIGKDEAVVGMVARLEPVKGPVYFLRACIEVARTHQNVKFIMVGEGSLRAGLEAEIKQAGLKDRFVLTGWRDDAPRIISMLDILVLSSLNEAVGMALIEAQAEGVAVIATKVGGTAEIVRDQQTGILVPAENTAELSHAITHLLNDPDKRKRMGQSGREWVKERFGAQDMVKRIRALYEVCLP